MVPTLKVGEVIQVRPIGSKTHLDRGDIIVFTAPAGSDPGVGDLVKRVIAVPGEAISADGGHIFINNKELSEPYLPPGTFTSDFETTKMPANSLLGDGR